MDEFIDNRDSNKYKIAKIGSLYWFAENLRYLGVPHCFPDRDSDNLQKYGCLYTWKNAMKACPKGWRLPTKEEFEKFLTTTEADSNSSDIRVSSWTNGSNSTRFGALPAGRRDHDGEYTLFGSHTYFWSTTPLDRILAYLLYVGPDHANIGVSDSSYAFSVRCVKDV